MHKLILILFILTANAPCFSSNTLEPELNSEQVRQIGRGMLAFYDETITGTLVTLRGDKLLRKFFRTRAGKDYGVLGRERSKWILCLKQLRSVASTLKDEMDELSTAHTELVRARTLFASGTITKDELDEALEPYEIDREKLDRRIACLARRLKRSTLISPRINALIAKATPRSITSEEAWIYFTSRSDFPDILSTMNIATFRSLFFAHLRDHYGYE